MCDLAIGRGGEEEDARAWGAFDQAEVTICASMERDQTGVGTSHKERGVEALYLMW